MKYLFIIFIKLYWRLFPEKNRRSCLFKESCSKYVFRIVNEDGFFKGISAFCERYKKCRPGYIIRNSKDFKKLELLLVDGSILNESDISDKIIEPYIKSAKGLEKKLKEL